MPKFTTDISRRRFIATIAMAPAALSFAQQPVRRSTDNEIIFASAGALARWIREKRFSSLEVVEAHLRRIEQVNPRLNALVFSVADSARAAARTADRDLAAGRVRGPLHGVPVTIKDSLDTEGIVTTAGTPTWIRRVPTRDATVVARLRAAGAIILGKTNTPEFTLSDETDNEVYGRTNNPYDLSRTPGGSSGGAAALIAAGGSPLDLGSDTGNSIRLPSHFCGVAGIKPTSGRVPRTGHVISFAGYMESWTQIGPMARFVDDLILTLPIIGGPDWIDPHVMPVPLQDPARVNLRGLRVAMHVTNGFAPPTAATQAAVRDASRVLLGRGALVEEKTPPGLAESFDLYGQVMFADGGTWINRLGQEAGGRGGGVQSTARSRPASDLSRLVEQMDAVRSRMLSFLENVDIILCPVHSQPAVRHGGSAAPEFGRGDSYSVAFNVTGWPAASVRVAASPEGLPIGVQVVGRPWREDQVLAVAKALEAELGGWKRPSI